MSPEKEALVALRRMRAKIEELEKARAESVAPIAIVGLGCRFPGGATDGDTFWRLLDEGRDAVTEVPSSRWDLESFFDPDPEASGKIATRHGGFLPEIETFDAAFFGISPREAASVDPQQRLVLEVSWEALENAGLAPDRLTGTPTGVFIGVSTNDYAHLHIAADPGDIDAYFGTGVALASVAGRLSYVLGLSGPSLVVDTACSSSLVSIHLAIQSLRTRECDMALAGGVNVILSPEVSVAFSRAQMMARDGRCKTFDASADGYVRSEGCGMVVLKRLSDALAGSDRILAVVRGSALNQDGRSAGLTAPNESAQRVVIQKALANASVAPASVSYVEAHGTGTKLGDPIELQALAEALGDGRTAEARLLVGSVKTNVGHLEAAAGVAGLIKVVLSLQNERIPPHLHFREPNPYVPWDEIPISIPAGGRAWPRSGKPRLAGVSSFGFTGTNAHVVLEEAPEPRLDSASARPLDILTLSARTETALVELARRYASTLEAGGSTFADASYTANTGRARFPHRLAVVASSSREAASKLRDFVSGGEPGDLGSHFRGRVAGEAPRIAFLFSGQGSQYRGMGRELFASEPVFQDALERCDHVLRPYLDRPLLSVLHAEDTDGLLDETVYTQPALFALEYALFELWRSWGVEPSYVMGHSAGEYAAACVAGVFGLEEGLRLIAARGRLMQSLPADGRMAAVFCDESEARARLSPEVAIAAVNGPRNVVLSGPEAALSTVLSRLEHEGVRWRDLPARRAFHAPSVETILDRFEREVEDASLCRPRLGLASNLTGELADSEVTTPSYWRAHLRQPVQFRRGVETLMKKGCDVVVELGPSSTLIALGLECAPESEGLWVSSLRKGRSEKTHLLSSLAALHVRGVEIDWSRFHSGGGRRRVALPTYPFEREPHWIRTPRKKREAVGDSTDWIYEVFWQEAPARRAERAGSMAARLVRFRYRILDDGGELSHCLRLRLEARGASASVVPRDVDFERLDGIDAPSPLTVVALPAAGEDPIAGCLRLSKAVQALARRRGMPARLFIVSKGGQAVSSLVTEEGLRSSPLWGLGRVIGLEHPDLFSGLVDLESSPSPSDIEALLDYFGDPGPEDEVAIRNGRLLAARLDHAAPALNRGPSYAPRGTVLITGGLGFIGVRLCRWLSERGARSLIVTTRRDLPPEASWSGIEGVLGDRLRTLSDLKRSGLEIEVRRSDAANREDLNELLRSLDSTGRFPRSVFHLAGAFPGARAAAELDYATLSATFLPKVAGASNLDELTTGRELDAFVLFSSAAAVWGASGLGAYAAANHYLDSLAHRRRSLGLPATSVAWARWGNTAEEHESYFEGIGLAVMAPERAFRALGEILSSGVAQATVADVDFRLFKSVYEARRARPFLERLDSKAVAREEKPAEVLSLDGLGVAERREALTEFLRESLSVVLGLGEPSRVRLDEPLLKLGLDSLMAVRLKSRILSGAGVDVPVAALLEGSSLRDLASTIEDQRGAAPAESIPRLSPLRPGENLPLSFAQQRLWFLHQLDPESSLYNNVGIYRFEGVLERAALLRSLQEIVTRHEVLRTTFASKEGQPIQRISPGGAVDVPLLDLSGLDADSLETEFLRVSRAATAEPFDLESGPVFRFLLLRLGLSTHVLLAIIHHIASDGWSFGALLEQIETHYRKNLGAGPDVSDLPIQYGDYASWQRNEDRRGAFDPHVAYWREELRGPLPELPLPLDHARPPLQTFRGKVESLSLSKPLSSALAELGRRSEATTFMTLLAGLAGLLSRMTGETDLLIGSPTSSRHHAQVRDLVGVFVNHLVLRIDVSSDPAFGELVSRVRGKALGAYRHQDLPFEKLLEKLAPERDLSRTPLFQVYFNLMNLPEGRRSLPGVTVEMETPREAESKFDLTFYAVQRTEAIEIAAVYNSDLFEESTIASMLSDYQALLEGGVSNPELPLSRIPLRPAEARRSDDTVRRRIGGGPRAERRKGLFSERFQEQVARNEDRIAVSTSDHLWTYGDLNRHADKVAAALAENVRERGARVGLLLGHDAPMVASVVGALKAGVAYVPLDPGYPEDRLSAMLSDSGSSLIVTENRFLPLARALGNGRVPAIAFEDVEDVDAFRRGGIGEDAGPDSLAYILYTSGSTGRPKGVMQSQVNLIHHASCYGESLAIDSSDRLSLLASFSFDAAVMDLFGALLHGAALVPIDVRRIGHEALAERIREERVTIYHSTPTLFRYFTSSLAPGEMLPGVRAVVLGGEEVRSSDLSRFRERFEKGSVLVNGLGPTESTLSLQYFMDHETVLERPRVPVGYPVSGTRVLLLDRAGRPNELFGEIAVESDHVALGYWNQEAQTRDSFSKANEGTARTYRTGDVGRLLPDGAVEFLGRADAQVKIRGHRVEPREVELALERHPDVREAVVVSHVDRRGEAVLAAHVVLRERAPAVDGDLRVFLAERLPSYMVPSVIREVGEIPLTPTGKIDRRGLEVSTEADDFVPSSSAEPSSAIEKTLAGLWREILGVERVALDHSFFGLGGHSLLATQLASRVSKSLGVDLSIRALFEAPTLGEMAERLKARLTSRDRAVRPALSRLSRAAHRVTVESSDRAGLAEVLRSRR